ncbi:hypothetical protein ROZALSC1DRAFT_30656 [Rozella allomycis CSF55]|uniref:Uncharacterized protein n=1 Tax=Rozella allomycis (strain CSF55) TaxID=988480 RepID=A0A4P9YDN3_ROZAC|nr:hypothetical protein ROZALSC1DRAFT_30656 [Rozella allomycis CSF55]
MQHIPKSETEKINTDEKLPTIFRDDSNVNYIQIQMKRLDSSLANIDKIDARINDVVKTTFQIERTCESLLKTQEENEVFITESEYILNKFIEIEEIEKLLMNEKYSICLHPNYIASLKKCHENWSFLKQNNEKSNRFVSLTLKLKSISVHFKPLLDIFNELIDLNPAFRNISDDLVSCYADVRIQALEEFLYEQEIHYDDKIFGVISLVKRLLMEENSLAQCFMIALPNRYFTETELTKLTRFELFDLLGLLDSISQLNISEMDGFTDLVFQTLMKSEMTMDELFHCLGAIEAWNHIVRVKNYKFFIGNCLNQFYNIKLFSLDKEKLDVYFETFKKTLNAVPSDALEELEIISSIHENNCFFFSKSFENVFNNGGESISSDLMDVIIVLFQKYLACCDLNTREIDSTSTSFKEYADKIKTLMQTIN